jgi:acyl-CoA synthetase (NDP forming)/GNAT superfamily N-acetyltransferase
MTTGHLCATERVGVRQGADILLSDGSTARVRQIDPTDTDAVVRMHNRLSERTRYLRYFAATPRLSRRDLDRCVNVDHRQREAFVVELNAELIAIGQYHRAASDAEDAEVAFVVEDAYQRRGLGSVLLEYLAAAARDEGVVNFVADVLPVNAVMLRVFVAAGYPVERQYADGLVHLSFPIAPTFRSLAVQRAREQRADAASIARLLAPRAVGLYGARADGTGVGAALLRHLRSSFCGSVYAVHPRARQLAGGPTVASLAGVPGPVDLAVVAVPGTEVPEVVADAAAAGVHGVVVLSSGFAEASEAGAQAQDRLVRQVHDLGMRLVGPNCLGVANTAGGVRLNALLAPRLPLAGRVGVFSQSAALGTALLGEAERRALGLSSFVSAGNRADVSGSDLLQYWRDDPATGVVAMYLETWDNPQKFARTARELARRKPVVVVAGVTTTTPRQPGEPAGAPGRAAALFASSGVILVDTLRELLDVSQVLAYQPLPAGPRLAVVTNAGALAAQAEASATNAGLRLPPGYPLILGPADDQDGFVAATRSALADSNVDSVIVAYASALADDQDVIARVARALEADVEQAGKPMVTVLPGTVDYPPRTPNFRDVQEAVRALGRAEAYAAWRREPRGRVPRLPDADSARARRIVAMLAAGGGTDHAPVPSERQAARELLACYGIPMVDGVLPATGPLDPAVVGARSGVACLVEVVDDPAFGTVIGFGLGGVASDLFGDLAWRPAPLTDTDALALLLTPRAAPLLTGYRGSTPVDLGALADLLVRVGRLAEEHPRLRRLVLDPVIATADGCSVGDATVQVGRRGTRPDSDPRRLGS